MKEKDLEQDLIDAEAEKHMVLDELQAIRDEFDEMGVTLGELGDKFQNLRKRVIKLQLSIKG